MKEEVGMFYMVFIAMAIPYAFLIGVVGGILIKFCVGNLYKFGSIFSASIGAGVLALMPGGIFGVIVGSLIVGYGGEGSAFFSGFLCISGFYWYFLPGKMTKITSTIPEERIKKIILIVSLLNPIISIFILALVFL